MTVSNVTTASTQKLGYTKPANPKPVATNSKLIDADGDHDGDTSASDAKGIDIKG